MDINQIIDYLMPNYHNKNSAKMPQSLEEAKWIVEKNMELSCLAITQDSGAYVFKTIMCKNKICIDRSINVFDSIKKIITNFNIPVEGWRFIFHYKGDACNLKKQNFSILANSRNVGNDHIILWPLLMKSEYRFSSMKYSHTLHDEVNKYLNNPDNITWEDKNTLFIFRGRNSGNPFSCTQYPWDRNRGSRCDLLLEYLKLPDSLASSVDIGFNELYPKFKILKRHINDVEFLNAQFSDILIAGKTIADLQTEIKLVFNYIKPTMTKNKLLRNKYILCLEGFDCASSLCWVLASNSLAIVPPFHYENIIINSQYLKPYVHFLPIKEDYSNLQEIMHWATNNDLKCQEIVKNANNYMKHFLDENSMLFVQKKIIRQLLS